MTSVVQIDQRSRRKLSIRIRIQTKTVKLNNAHPVVARKTNVTFTLLRVSSLQYDSTYRASDASLQDKRLVWVI